MKAYRCAKFEHGDGWVDCTYFLHRKCAVQHSKLNNLRLHHEHESYRAMCVARCWDDPGPLGRRGYRHFVVHEIEIFI